MRLARLVGLLIAVGMLLGASAVPAAEPTLVNIGVLAKRGPEITLKRWQATADYLTDHVSGYRFRIIPLGFDEVFSAADSGQVQFILANSAFYVELEMQHGASRIVTLRNRYADQGFTRFGGVIFTRADRRGINSLDDLAGHSFGAVEPTSLGGYLAALRELKSAGLEPVADLSAVHFFGTHDAVVQAVLDGKVYAGTVRTDTLETMAREGRIDLKRIRVIAPRAYKDFPFRCSTRLYPEWPLARLPSTPERLSDAVASALLAMPADSEAALDGGVTGWAVPLNYQPVHNIMRELQVGPYANLGRVTARQVLQQYGPYVMLVLAILVVLSAITAYVASLNRSLRHSRAELQDARVHLEERVAEQTSELRTALTEVSTANAMLDLSRRQWNEAFNAIEHPIFIHDRGLRLLRANLAYAHEAGVDDPEKLVGELYWKQFPRLGQPLQACSSFPEDPPHGAEEAVLDDGRIFRSRSFSMLDENGELSSAVHILEDVTARRVAEAEKRVLSQALEQAGDGILLLNADGTIRFGNAALWLMLRAQGEAYQDAPLERIFPPALLPDLKRLLNAARDGGWNGEVEVLAADGRVIPIHLSITGVTDAYQRHTGYVLTAVDLSYVKEAEAALTYRLEFERVVADIASRFVNVASEDVTKEMVRVLEEMGRFAGAARCYLRINRGKNLAPALFEWQQEGVRPRGDGLETMTPQRLPWLCATLKRSEVVLVNSPAELPAEAEGERDWLAEGGVGALMAFPMVSAGIWLGFVAFEREADGGHWGDELLRLLTAPVEIIANAWRRKYAEEAVHASEASLAEAQRIAHLGNWDWDVVANTITASEEVFRIFGIEPTQFDGSFEGFVAHVHPDDRDSVKRMVEQALGGGERFSEDHRVLRPDGSTRTVHDMGAVRFDETGRPLRMIGTLQDVTDTRRAELELHRLNRALRTLSRGNETLVRATDETQLVHDLCSILTELGGYAFAWVGYVEHDEARSVRPVAEAGAGVDLAGARISWGDNERGHGPTGTAIREGHNVTIHDLLTDPRYTPWRPAAELAGHRAMIALPLKMGKTVIGALTIVSTDPDAFDIEEVRMLSELANDLSYGIRSLRSRAQRRRAEAALKESETRFRAIFETAVDGVVVCEQGSLLVRTTNRAFGRMSGYTVDELRQRPLSELFAPEVRERVVLALGSAHGKPLGPGAELPLTRRDGSVVYVDVSATPISLEGKQFVLGEFHDVSERKQAEEERRRGIARLQAALVQTIQAMAVTIEKRDPYTAGHQQRVADMAVAIAGRMGWDADRIEGLRLGAMIHDIGKIYIPTEVLNRPGKLSPMEFELIKLHPSVGYDIVKSIEFPWPVAEMVVQHHERLDGSGYPAGLRGEEISPEARVIAVADIVEAISTHRPYRPAHSIDVAVEELRAHRGTHYDPAVVDVCIALIEEGELPKAAV